MSATTEQGMARSEVFALRRLLETADTDAERGAILALIDDAERRYHAAIAAS